MEIIKCLTLSSAHIKESTAAALNDECNWEEGSMGLCAYKKRGFGWWISVPDKADLEDLCKTVPHDLMACLQLAVEYDCGLLCLDCAGDTAPGLLTYDW